MTLDELSQTIAASVPLATFIALAVSIFIFVRYKGTIDALKEAAATYKSLSEAREAKIEQLEYDLECCKSEIAELKRNNAVQREAIAIAIDEALNGFVRHGICARAGDCPDFAVGRE